MVPDGEVAVAGGVEPDWGQQPAQDDGGEARAGKGGGGGPGPGRREQEGEQATKQCER